MMRFTAVTALFPDLGETELHAWVERGWVRPQGTDPDWFFAEIDVARVRLIHDFRHAMDVREETIPLILSLLDQVYTLRSQMRAIARAVDSQPEAVRTAIMTALRE